jgi:hypothetical protein
VLSNLKKIPEVKQGLQKTYAVLPKFSPTPHSCSSDQRGDALSMTTLNMQNMLWGECFMNLRNKLPKQHEASCHRACSMKSSMLYLCNTRVHANLLQHAVAKQTHRKARALPGGPGSTAAPPKMSMTHMLRWCDQ